MRVLFPRTEIAHPLAVAAIARYAPQAEIIDLTQRANHNHDAYHRLLYEAWLEGEGFLIVEHDVEIGEGTVAEFEACDGDWCLARYGAPGNKPDDPRWHEGALGCTRFSSRLIAEMPNLILDLPVRRWQSLDCEILPALLQAGWERCFKHEPVSHHHHYGDAIGGCACGGGCEPHASP